LARCSYRRSSDAHCPTTTRNRGGNGYSIGEWEGDTLVEETTGFRDDVWLDVTGVSRQHARIRIDSATRTVALDDLDSTNGTFLRRLQIRAQEPLTDGDIIGIGSAELRFREWSQDKPRETERIHRLRRIRN